MKEIKFRVWDKESQTMQKVGALDWDCDFTVITCNTETNKLYMYEEDDFILMQYTNNNTWSSQEVYESDILKDCDGELYEVIWKDDGWRVKELKTGWDGYPLSWVLGNDQAVVVGNIYEGYEV